MFTLSFSRRTMSRRFISIVILIAFALTSFVPPSAAQTIFSLPAPGTMVTPSAPFMPVLVKGMTVHPENPLRFDFIVDSGHEPRGVHGDGTPAAEEAWLRQESNRLIKYFLASLTIPKDELWVNLSPYEHDRMIPEALSKTGLGQDLLAQDYLLKQLTASLMYPEDELGAAFWEKVYAQAKEKFGTTDIPLDTFNKVWIIPESASVYEHENTVYVVGAKLKVMLETDYKALQENRESKGENGKSNETINPSSILDSQSSILREIIIPAIEKEVNEGKNFAPLRQIYNSLILAQWYKETVKNSILTNVYVDKAKMVGIDDNDPASKEKIYEQYMAAYKKGVYNLIKEEYDSATQDVIPHKYFSGGFKNDLAMLTRVEKADINDLTGSGTEVTVDLAAQTVAKDADMPGVIILQDSVNASRIDLKKIQAIVEQVHDNAILVEVAITSLGVGFGIGLLYKLFKTSVITHTARTLRIDPDIDKKIAAAKFLFYAKNKNPLPAPDLINALNSENEDLKIWVIGALSFIGKRHKNSIGAIIDIIARDTSIRVRQQAIFSLGLYEESAIDAVPVLGEVLKDGTAVQLHAGAREALEYIGRQYGDSAMLTRQRVVDEIKQKHVFAGLHTITGGHAYLKTLEEKGDGFIGTLAGILVEKGFVPIVDKLDALTAVRRDHADGVVGYFVTKKSKKEEIAAAVKSGADFLINVDDHFEPEAFKELRAAYPTTVLVALVSSETPGLDAYLNAIVDVGVDGVEVKDFFKITNEDFSQTPDIMKKIRKDYPELMLFAAGRIFENKVKGVLSMRDNEGNNLQVIPAVGFDKTDEKAFREQAEGYMKKFADSAMLADAFKAWTNYDLFDLLDKTVIGGFTRETPPKFQEIVKLLGEKKSKKVADYLAEEFCIAFYEQYKNTDARQYEKGILNLFKEIAESYNASKESIESLRKKIEAASQNNFSSPVQGQYDLLRELLVSPEKQFDTVDFPGSGMPKVSSIQKYGDVVFLPTQGNLYVIGDTHGDADSTRRILIDIINKNNEVNEAKLATSAADTLIFAELKALLSKEKIQKKIQIVFTGDYINNGLKNVDNLLFVLQLQSRFPENVVLLSGNHEFRETYGTVAKEYFRTHWDNATNNPNPRVSKDPRNGTHYGHIRLELMTRFGISRGEELYRKFEDWGRSLPVVAFSNKGIMMSHSLGWDDSDVTFASLADLKSADDQKIFNELGYEAWKDEKKTLHSKMVNNRDIDKKLLDKFQKDLGVNVFLVGHSHFRSGDIHTDGVVENKKKGTIAHGDEKGRIVTLSSSYYNSPDAGHYMYNEFKIVRNGEKGEGRDGVANAYYAFFGDEKVEGISQKNLIDFAMLGSSDFVIGKIQEMRSMQPSTPVIVGVLGSPYSGTEDLAREIVDGLTGAKVKAAVLDSNRFVRDFMFSPFNFSSLTTIMRDVKMGRSVYLRNDHTSEKFDVLVISGTFEHLPKYWDIMRRFDLKIVSTFQDGNVRLERKMAAEGSEKGSDEILGEFVQEQLREGQSQSLIEEANIVVIQDTNTVIDLNEPRFSSIENDDGSFDLAMLGAERISSGDDKASKIIPIEEKARIYAEAFRYDLALHFYGGNEDFRIFGSVIESFENAKLEKIMAAYLRGEKIADHFVKVYIGNTEKFIDVFKYLSERGEIATDRNYSLADMQSEFPRTAVGEKIVAAGTDKNPFDSAMLGDTKSQSFKVTKSQNSTMESESPGGIDMNQISVERKKAVAAINDKRVFSSLHTETASAVYREISRERGADYMVKLARILIEQGFVPNIDTIEILTQVKKNAPESVVGYFIENTTSDDTMKSAVAAGANYFINIEDRLTIDKIEQLKKEFGRIPVITLVEYSKDTETETEEYIEAAVRAGVDGVQIKKFFRLEDKDSPHAVPFLKKLRATYPTLILSVAGSVFADKVAGVLNMADDSGKNLGIVPAIGLDKRETVDTFTSHVQDFKKEIDPVLVGKTQNPGGIDMNQISVERNGEGAAIEFDAAVMQNIVEQDIIGFTPVIINMTPVPSVLPLLGLNKDTKTPGHKTQEVRELVAVVEERG